MRATRDAEARVAALNALPQRKTREDGSQYSSAIREREVQIAKLDVQLRAPRQAPPNIEKLREALHQRAEEWKADLRAEPKVARLLLRRLVGSLTLWDAAEPAAEWDEWVASLTPALLEGLAHPVHHGSSPTGTVERCNLRFRGLAA